MHRPSTGSRAPSTRSMRRSSRPSTADAHCVTDQPALARLACLAGRSWRVQELPGGLTNTNLRVQTDDGRDLVVRWSHGDAALLGIDRNAEAFNTRAAAEAGV